MNRTRRGMRTLMVMLAGVLCAPGWIATSWAGVNGEVETDVLTVLQNGMFYGDVLIERAAASTNTLTLYYDFAQSTNPIPDLSGNSNTGNVSGAVWTDGGRFGGGYSFDGVDDYISVGDKLDLTGAITDLTVCAWVYTLTTNNQMVVGKNQTANPYTGWALFLLNGNKPFAELLGDYNLGERVYSECPVSIGTNEWHFLAARYHADPSSMWSSIFLDGVLMATNSRVGTHIAIDTSAELWVGRRSPDGVLPYMGIEDEVRIYTRWLSDAEISGLYHYGITNAGFRVSAPAILEHLARQGDIEMGTFTNEP